MPETMKAVVKPLPAPGALLEEHPLPRPGPRDLLVRVKAASICGTDLHIYNWDRWAQGRIRPPLIFGHEFCGEVVECGTEVTSLRPGDFLSAETHIPCGSCYQCRTGSAHICERVEIVGIDRPGCFADYVVIPESAAYRMDRSIPIEVAAIQDPYGNAVHTVLAGEVAGLTLMVIGCGPIGLAAIAVARACGAEAVYASDINPYRLSIAEKMGARLALNARETDVVRAILDATSGHGVDVVVEMSGNPEATQQGFKVLRKGGRMSLLGIPKEPFPIDLANDVIFKGAVVQGINGRRIWKTWYTGQALLRSGAVDLSPLISHKLTLDRFEEGFSLLKEGRAAKVILYP